MEIAKDGDRARVTARDDGKGAVEVREGNGLRGLRERIEELGGTFEIEALLGRGMELRALVPLKSPQETTTGLGPGPQADGLAA